MTEPITLWPLEITHAEFIPTPAAFGFEVAPEIMSGMRITLNRRTAATRDLEPALERPAQKPEHWISSCRISELPIHILTGESEAIRIYEMLFARCRGVYVRYEDEHGDPVTRELPRDCLRQVGLEPSEGLFFNDKRVFHGFDLLRELFIFPQKFLGFRLQGLQHVMPQVTARSADIIFAFDRSDSRLGSVVRAPIFSLYTAPAVNLFEMTTARIPIRSNEHEYQVIPDRSWQLGYEPLRILKVFAHLPGKSEKVEVYPLYSAPPSDVPTAAALFYTSRRTPRRQTVEERRFGRSSNYTGTDVFISMSGHAGEHGELGVTELSVRALCSNRHLTEHLPVGQGGADFILESNTSLAASCVAGPTNPRESMVSRAAGRDATVQSGTPAWRLISILSLNHLGLTGRGTHNSAEALREILSLFADTGDSATARRIRGILSVESRVCVRRIRRAEGAGAARGIEITVTFDEKSYEGSGIYLFGAILERFFSAYAPINNFTETVIESKQRGVIKRWPPRGGAGRVL
jgi:type VI secretion system protein ImpG